MKKQSGTYIIKTMEVLESDYEGRVNLIDEMIFTIDGKDTKDIDDAISLKILDNGNYLLKVSIADVTNYVKFGSALFNDAYNKGNSTYMADKVEPMLPVELSNGICSLNPGVDRLAMSVIMEVDKNGHVVNRNIWLSKGNGPVILEVFTTDKDESDALKLMNSIVKDESIKTRLKRSRLGRLAKKMLRRG